MGWWNDGSGGPAVGASLFFSVGISHVNGEAGSVGEKDRRDDVQRVEWSAVQCSAVRSDIVWYSSHQ